MTKPMSKGCIEKHPPPSWLEINLLLETIDLGEEIGRLFVVDIESDKKKATGRRVHV